MPSVINQLLQAELTTRLRGLSHAILVDHTGLSSRQADGVRAMLREHGSTLLVVKNSLATRALRDLDLDGVAALIDGPTALVYGGDDPVILSKALVEWGRKERALAVRGGLVEGRALSAEEVQQIAALPPVQVLRALVVGAIASPLSGFVGALQGIVRSFVGVVKAIADKRQES